MEITINKTIQIKVSVKDKGVFKNKQVVVETIFDELGELDIIQANEINSSKNYSLFVNSDQKLYTFSANNLKELNEKKVTEMPYLCTLKEHINPAKQSHRDFLEWYFGKDFNLAKNELI